MSAERLIVAVLTGGITASLTYAISTGLHTKHVWPGTIFGFCLTTLGMLMTRRRGR